LNLAGCAFYKNALEEGQNSVRFWD